jgi:threonine dehydrogenase-like Zn-dependent dehydrogenase
MPAYTAVIYQLNYSGIQPEALISRILPGSQTQKGFEILEQEPAENIKILLNFQV